MKLNDTIAKVEHHPTGLMLLLDDGDKFGGGRTQVFLTGAKFEPKRDDVVLMDGQSGSILSGGKEHHIRLVKGNQLSVVEAPEDQHGHA